MDIKELFKAIDRVKVFNHFHTIKENNKVNKLLSCFTAQDSVIAGLQDKAISLLDARNFSNGLKKKYPSLHSRLHANTSVIFEPRIKSSYSLNLRREKGYSKPHKAASSPSSARIKLCAEL